MKPSPAILAVVRLAAACGACTVGGPLSYAEEALLDMAGCGTRSAGRRIRAQIRDGADPLGDALRASRSALERRALGAFYTSDAIVNPMVEWALAHRPERFVDPGCGSGRFSVEAARRSRTLKIVAVDLDPVATVLTRAALAAVGARNAKVLNADYMTVSLEGAWGRTAFVGNPPYVRHHDLRRATKTRASKMAARLGYSLSGLAGLHALFYLATAARHAVKGDIGTFVTSAEWLDVGYGSIVRDLFANSLGGESIAMFDPHLKPFEEAMTTAAIATFCVGSEHASARISKVISTAELRLGIGRSIERAALAATDRWSQFANGAPSEAGVRTIGTLFRVSRGQVTGANAFFTMSREEARLRGIEAFCSPLVAGAQEIFAADSTLRDSPERLLGLEIPRDFDVATHAKLAEYIAAGEAAGVHRGYIASLRKPWYAVSYPRPPIVATYMARQAPRFAHNPDRLGLLNVVHGLFPHRPLNDATLLGIVNRLNAARESFVGRGRTYHGGLEKFEPREMENLPLL